MMRGSIRKRGETRVKSGFLLFPKWINHQWRWLEYAKWEQRWSSGLFHYEWWNIKWVDDE